MTMLSARPAASAAPTPEAFVPELLLPAGDMERFRTAVLYGANAVYLGGTTGNLRASSQGLSTEELREAVTLANASDVKIYYCLNSMPFERQMAAIPDIAATAADADVHAFIVADPGIFRIVRRIAPHIPVHVSTQANTTNAEAVMFWRDLGASRVNMARELSFRDIASIRNTLPEMELEVFLHGAMCLAVSGQCLLSAWINNRPANQGKCTQPCRFEYRAVDAVLPEALVVEEALRPGKGLWSIQQDEDYAAVFAPEDLCLLPFLRWFMKKRITSLKVEGRMKGSAYVAHVADTYRSAIDAAAVALASGSKFPFRRYLPDLARTALRPLSTGFFLPERRRLDDGYKRTAKQLPLLGRVTEPVDTAKGAWAVEVRGRWDTNAAIELMLPGMRRPVLSPGEYAVENHRGEKNGIAASGTRATLYTDREDIEPGIFIRGVV